MRLINLHTRKVPKLTEFGHAVSKKLALLSMPCVDRIDVILVNDAKIAELSGRYRGSRHPTDVLAFWYGGDEQPSGEIVISLDTAARQARERGVPLMHELKLLIVHGFLHLDGAGDESRRQWCEMRRREFESMVRILG